MRVAPKKHLGQHFLKDENIASQIAGILTGNNYEQVLEIGPGMGVLTKYLLENKKFETICIEIDKESVSYLKDHYPSLKVFQEDFLRADPSVLMEGKPFAVIGNFPYNISSQIVFRILDFVDLVPEFGGMFQKEVAVRFASGPGNRDYGIISVLLQTYYDVSYCFTVNEDVFIPPPKVKSGVIFAKRKANPGPTVNRDFYFKVVKHAFNQRRKTLKNALSTFGFRWEESKCEGFAKLRAEQLNVESFDLLANEIEKQRKGNEIDNSRQV